MMELFTLGPGRFSESDVKEVARALTGWNVEGGAFREMPARHDDGLKTILGKTGNWNATDLVRIILEQPATAHRLAWRICDTLMGEGAVDPDAIRALGDSLRRMITTSAGVSESSCAPALSSPTGTWARGFDRRSNLS